MKAYKRLFLALLSCVTIIASAGCTSSAIPDAAEEEEEEEKTAETLTIEDKEYYRRFRDDGISINVYNWGEYICDGSAEGTLDVNREFEELTGINVNYTTFGSNEELYAKLRDGAVSYDVVIPSDYMISRFIKEGLVQKLDMSNIPNSKYIPDTFKGLEYDPNDEYSVPYTWGTVGIIYNKEVIGIEEEDIDWDILWNEDYSGEILMFDNPRGDEKNQMPLPHGKQEYLLAIDKFSKEKEVRYLPAGLSRDLIKDFLAEPKAFVNRLREVRNENRAAKSNDALGVDNVIRRSNTIKNMQGPKI